MKYLLIFLFTAVLGLPIHAQKPVKLKPIAKKSIMVPEPSDFCLSEDGASLYVVSDDGYVFETDLEGKILRKANYKGYDCEGIWLKEGLLYIVEEMTRKIAILKTDNLTEIRKIHLPYGGGRNKGYEAITYNEQKGRFILLTEKDPIYLFELDDQLNIQNEYNLTGIARDIAAATWHNGKLYLLSDEDMQIIQVDPLNYEVLQRWYVPVINPEGILFKSDQEVWILSDDMQQFFIFKIDTNEIK
jgi:uncharacterized protein YjiK